MSFQQRKFYIEDTEGHGVRIEYRVFSEVPQLFFTFAGCVIAAADGCPVAFDSAPQGLSRRRLLAKLERGALPGGAAFGRAPQNPSSAASLFLSWSWLKED
jgi:hypothetical protein